MKYRGVAVADTARERPVLTVQLLDKQPRLTVSTIEDKRQALLAGLGVATTALSAGGEGYCREVACGSSARNTPMKLTLSWPGDGTSMGEAGSPGVCVRSPSCLPADSDERRSSR